ncbi:MAG: hypothetical protein HY902_00435 [Deltaproteobacteria bacterium]|nr:hypothetical protein [Deltaproteobacteria bacterium]
MQRIRGWVGCACILLSVASCGSVETATPQTTAADGGQDGATGGDGSTADSGKVAEDTAVSGQDAAADAASQDAAASDSISVDAEAPDTAVADTSGADSTVADSTVADTTAADSGGVDTGTDTALPAKPAEMGQPCDPAKPLCGNMQICKAWADGKNYCFCPDGKPYKSGICEGDTSQVQSMCAYLKKDCAGEGYCFDVTKSTCDYLAQKKLTHPACDVLGNNKSVAACVSAITDKTSPYFGSAECPLVQYWSNPSDYPIDCRCAGKLENLCKRPYNLEPKISFGEGPRMRTLASTVQAWNGVVVGGEWLLPVGWKTASKPSQTMIFGIDLKTGKRRYVSGAYDDPALGYQTVGKGDAFVNVMDIKLGADGMLYAVGGTSDIAPPKVWKIDPTTGDRTKLFDEEKADPATLCPNGSTLPGKKVVQMVPEGFAMDADGNFYFGYINMPGRGIVKFDKAFAKCSFLTMVPDMNQSTTSKTPIGGGYDSIQFEMRGLEIVDKKLYAIADTKLIEVDLATGDRKLISNAKDIGGLGAGPINAEGLGDRWSKWDPYRKVLWTHGISGGSSAVVVDLATGDRTPWPCWHPTLGIQGACGNTGTALIPGYLSYGGMIIDPSPPHDLYFAHDLFAVVKYEIKTGNSYILSL